MSPIVLTYLAIRDRTFPSLVSAFGRAVVAQIGDVLPSQSADMRAARRARARLLQVIAAWEDDQKLSFFADYCEVLQGLEQSLFPTQFDSVRLAQEFFDLLEGHDETESVPNEALTLREEDFACIVAHALDYLRPERFVLVPAAYWNYLPFAPLESSYECLDVLHQLLPESGTIGTQTLRVVAEEKGLECTAVFVDAVASSDPRFLTVRRGRERFTGRRTVLLPRLEAVAHNTRRSDYIKHERRPFAEDGTVHMYVLQAPQILSDRVRQLFAPRQNTSKEVDVFDWSEVGSKMLHIALSSETKVQGLGASLHSQIVHALLKKAGAMSLAELDHELGLSIPLSPDTLPPGPIMAYAPHPRFLKPENAVYVLQDWVETDTDKRGKILRARVVTPFRNKRWQFTEEMAFDACEKNALYAQCGLVVVDALVDDLVNHLPDRPSELYFRSLIRERLERVLAKRMVNLGKGVFSRQDVSIERGCSQSSDAWRIETIRSALRQKPHVDLEEFVQKFEDQALKVQALQAIRGHAATAYQRY